MSDTGPEDIEALVDEVTALRVENQRLRSLLGLDEPSRLEVTDPWEPTLFVDSVRKDLKGDVNANSPAAAKIALFRLLFAGREDVHALRWESSRTGKTGWSPAVVGGWANAKKPGRTYVPLDEGVVESAPRWWEPPRSLSTAPRRRMSTLGLRFRWKRLGARCAGLPRRRCRNRRSCCARAITLGGRSAHVDVLFWTGRGFSGSTPGSARPPPGNGTTSRARFG